MMKYDRNQMVTLAIYRKQIHANTAHRLDHQFKSFYEAAECFVLLSCVLFVGNIRLAFEDHR